MRTGTCTHTRTARHLPEHTAHHPVGLHLSIPRRTPPRLTPPIPRTTAHQLDYTGTICTELGLLTNMEYLEFQGNSLTGTIPSQLGMLGDVFVMLDVRLNQLTGTVPTQVGRGQRHHHRSTPAAAAAALLRRPSSLVTPHDLPIYPSLAHSPIHCLTH